MRKCQQSLSIGINHHATVLFLKTLLNTLKNYQLNELYTNNSYYLQVFRALKQLIHILKSEINPHISQSTTARHYFFIYFYVIQNYKLFEQLQQKIMPTNMPQQIITLLSFKLANQKTSGA